VFIGGKIDWMPDDYNIRKKIAAEERKYHESKLQERPFS